MSMASENVSLYITGPNTLMDSADPSSIEYNTRSSFAAFVLAAGLYSFGVAVM